MEPNLAAFPGKVVLGVDMSYHEGSSFPQPSQASVTRHTPMRSEYLTAFAQAVDTLGSDHQKNVISEIVSHIWGVAIRSPDILAYLGRTTVSTAAQPKSYLNPRPESLTLQSTPNPKPPLHPVVERVP